MTQRTRASRGFVLLDAMIAILIFSFGILGMIALQAAATKLGGDAKYRTDAAMLADQVIAQMWVSSLSADSASLAANFKGSDGTGGAAYTAWANSLDCANAAEGQNCLPGVAANKPSIDVDDNSIVTVTIKWQAPNDETPHQYVSVTHVVKDLP